MVKLILLDRDGVLNEEVEGFVKSKEELKMIPGSAGAVARLKNAGLKVAVVTNQSVVGRGIINEAKLNEIHKELEKNIKAEGGGIDHIFYCTDAPWNETVRRKPNPGMIDEAMDMFGAGPDETVMIGDSYTDFQAAKAAGCGFVLVRTGKGGLTLKEKEVDLRGLNIYRSISEAVDGIIGGDFEKE